MSTGSEESEAENAAAGGDNENCNTTPFLKFCRWAAPSVQNPSNLPHYLIAAFTFFLAGFALFAWIESKKSTYALQGQLTVLRDEQRPWIYADIAEEEKVFINQSGGYTFTIKFIYHNTGHQVAKFVWPAVEIRPVLDSNTVLDWQKSVCDKRRKFQPANNLVGTTIFPGQTIFQSLGLGISAEDWKSALDKMQNIGIAPLIAGCIDYQIPKETLHHTTGLAYVIGQRKDGKTGTFVLPPDPTQVAVDHLIFNSWIEGGAFGAD